MLTEYTVRNWKKKFIEELEKQVNMNNGEGAPYMYGGGQMHHYTFQNGKQYSGIDDQGRPLGFDCSGGIIYALEQATGIEFNLYPPRSFFKRDWLIEIKEEELQEGDLILVDIPKMKGSSPLQNDDGQIVYGVIDHVMTYVHYHDGYDIITTEGEGGDIRINPNSKATTRRWKLSNFKRVSNRIFKGATLYYYRKINWEWLLNWKKTHQA